MGLKLPRKLDLLDLQILESLAKHGPRNISYVARRIGLPAETVRKRLKRITSKLFVRFNINIFHTNLGLKKAVVFAEATPGRERTLFDCLKINDFWLFLARCYGRFEGCVGVFTIPVNYCAEFEKFLQKVTELGLAKSVQMFWSTCFHDIPFSCNWFDRKSQTWIFKWDKWIEEIKTADTKLPYTLEDPKEFPIKGDEIDLFILKELEKDARVDLSVLGKKLRISTQVAEYHFKKHIFGHGLIENFDLTFLYLEREVSDAFFFIFRFEDKETLSRFASSLMDKPFAWTLGKVLGDNALIAVLYFSKSEFRRFIDSLSVLIKSGFLQNYFYVIQDLEKTSRQTISYEYFKDGKWRYDHKKHIKNLEDLVKAEDSEKRLTALAIG